eukprot:403349278
MHKFYVTQNIGNLSSKIKISRNQRLGEGRINSTRRNLKIRQSNTSRNFIKSAVGRDQYTPQKNQLNIPKGSLLNNQSMDSLQDSNLDYTIRRQFNQISVDNPNDKLQHLGRNQSGLSLIQNQTQVFTTNPTITYQASSPTQATQLKSKNLNPNNSGLGFLGVESCGLGEFSNSKRTHSPYSVNESFSALKNLKKARLDAEIEMSRMINRIKKLTIDDQKLEKKDEQKQIKQAVIAQNKSTLIPQSIPIEKQLKLIRKQERIELLEKYERNQKMKQEMQNTLQYNKIYQMQQKLMRGQELKSDKKKMQKIKKKFEMEQMKDKIQKHDIIRFYKENVTKQRINQFRESKIISARKDRSQQYHVEEKLLQKKEKQLEKARKVQEALEQRIKQKMSMAIFQSITGGLGKTKLLNKTIDNSKGGDSSNLQFSSLFGMRGYNDSSFNQNSSIDNETSFDPMQNQSNAFMQNQTINPGQIEQANLKSQSKLLDVSRLSLDQNIIQEQQQIYEMQLQQEDNLEQQI